MSLRDAVAFEGQLPSPLVVSVPSGWRGLPERQVALHCRCVPHAGERETYVDVSPDGATFAALGVTGRWDRRDSSLWFSVSPEAREQGVSNGLRLWSSLCLPFEHHGLMLHAACAIHQEHGIVLAGHSGAGKSTFALGLHEATYLSDDITLVRDLSTSPWLLSSPFYGSAGRLGVDQSAPLRAVGVLRQARQTSIRRLHSPEAIVQLMRHVVNFTLDASVCRAILEHVVALTERVPIFDVARSLETTSDELCDLLLRAAEEG